MKLLATRGRFEYPWYSSWLVLLSLYAIRLGPYALPWFSVKLWYFCILPEMCFPSWNLFISNEKLIVNVILTGILNSLAQPCVKIYNTSSCVTFQHKCICCVYSVKPICNTATPLCIAAVMHDLGITTRGHIACIEA